MRFLWLLGSVAVLIGVSITGYQGGELTYGEDHYNKEFERLFPEAFVEETDQEAAPDQDVIEDEDPEDSSTSDDSTDESEASDA